MPPQIRPHPLSFEAGVEQRGHMSIVLRMMLHYSRHADLMESYREHAAVLKAI